MRALVRWWARLVWVTIDPFVLGLFRLALGTLLTVYYVMQAPDWLEFYGPGGWAPTGASGRWLDPLFVHIHSDLGMWIFYAVCLIASVSLTLGWLWKLPVFWLWMSNYSIMYRNFGTTNAEEQILAILLLFGLFLPLDTALVAGRRARTRERVRVWALRPLQAYFVSIYLFSLPWKIMIEPAWYDGTLVYYATSELLYSRWPTAGALFGWGDGFLSALASYYTLIVEALFPFIVWLEPTRLVIVLAMMAMHASIGILLEGVTMFNAGMFVGLVLFLPSGASRRRFESVSRDFGLSP